MRTSVRAADHTVTGALDILIDLLFLYTFSLIKAISFSRFIFFFFMFILSTLFIHLNKVAVVTNERQIRATTKLITR